MAADNLPARMAEAIVLHEWTDFPRSAHNQHNYYAKCAVCQRDVPLITEVALSVLTEDPGDVPKRMAEAARDAFSGEPARPDGTRVLSDLRNPWRALDDAIAAALSVRDELVAHLAARAAKAEARVEYAEAGAQLSSERLAKVQQELAEAERKHQAKLASLQALADRCRERDWAHAAEQAKRREEAERESAGWRNAVARVLAKPLLRGPNAEHVVRVTDIRAAMAAPQSIKTTTTPARETA